MPGSESLAQSLIEQDRQALSKSITLVESSNPDDRKAAISLLDEVIDHVGNSFRIGISGSPGVGKSTFIEAFGLRLIESGHRVCVLTIDPSSHITGGSILGDKTRMSKLSTHPRAYVRPTPSGSRLGGVARRTREVILLAEAAGYDLILIETVGVGQSEITVADMSDMFLLLLQPASGDDLQGIKRGVMELADMVIVNKADGELLSAANHSALSYIQALKLMKSKSKNQHCGWTVPVVTCSSITLNGLDKVHKQVEQYGRVLTESGALEVTRQQQYQSWFREEVLANVQDALNENPVLAQKMGHYNERVSSRLQTPISAAAQLVHEIIPCLEN